MQLLKLLFFISCDPLGQLCILESDITCEIKKIRLSSAFPRFSFQSFSMWYHIQTHHRQILPSRCVLDTQRGSTYIRASPISIHMQDVSRCSTPTPYDFSSMYTHCYRLLDGGQWKRTSEFHGESVSYPALSFPRMR